VGDAAESVEFSGAGVVALALHPEVAAGWSGKVLMTTELAEAFGFADVDGTVHRPPHREPKPWIGGQGLGSPSD
jgi:hypothetical protein